MAERKTVLLRVRPDLYEALRRWAEDEFRSVNGQIEYILHRALQDSGRLKADAKKKPRSRPDGDKSSKDEAD